MASTINETQITFSSASSVSLSNNNRVDSDAVTLNIEDWDGSVQVSADTSGTPASGDTVDVYVKWSNGDVLGDSGDDFDTDEHAQFVCRLDTYAANNPGEDPARATIPLSVSGKKAFKLSVVANQGASRAVTFRARFVSHRPQ